MLSVYVNIVSLSLSLSLSLSVCVCVHVHLCVVDSTIGDGWVIGAVLCV